MSDQALQELPTEAGTLAPRNLQEAMEFSKLISQSAIVPKDYQGKPANVLVAVQWGMELGLAPMQAMQNIAVINGRPSIWGDAMLAICKAHPQFGGIEESTTDEAATCTVRRKGHPDVTQQFTMADAKRAGLSGKQGPWQQYPKRMMQMRARSFALRDQFADALKGIEMAEVVQDIPPERDMGPAQVVSDAPHESRTQSVKDKVKAKQAAAQHATDTESVDTETGEILPADAGELFDGPGYDEIMAALGNCDSAEKLDELRDMARSVYPNLEQSQKAQLTKAINAVSEELAA